MIRWEPSEVEQILETRFRVPDPAELPWDQPDFFEAKFEFGGLLYSLNIFPERELIWLRADLKNAERATPQFEFTFRCDRIRCGPGGYDSQSVKFEFSDGDEKVDFQKHCRLVIERMREGELYIWPAIGAADPAFEEGC